MPSGFTLGVYPGYWVSLAHACSTHPQGHVTGSLCATYAGSTSCFLPTRHLGRAVALLVSPFRPVTVGSFTSGTTCQKISGVRHAKRTRGSGPRGRRPWMAGSRGPSGAPSGIPDFPLNSPRTAQAVYATRSRRHPLSVAAPVSLVRGWDRSPDRIGEGDLLIPIGGDRATVVGEAEAFVGTDGSHVVQVRL